MMKCKPRVHTRIFRLISRDNQRIRRSPKRRYGSKTNLSILSKSKNKKRKKSSKRHRRQLRGNLGFLLGPYNLWRIKMKFQKTLKLQGIQVRAKISTDTNLKILRRSSITNAPRHLRRMQVQALLCHWLTRKIKSTCNEPVTPSIKDNFCSKNRT